MEIDSELLKSIGKNLGLKNKEFVEKNWFQDKLLYFLASKNDSLVFKGGTALYKFYSLPRFSEDLDFSSTKPIDENLIKQFCEQNNAILTYKKVHDSQLFKLRFKGVLTQANTIRLDININEKIYSYEPKSFVSAYPDVVPFVVKVMSLNEIIAEKFHGLLNRTKARDLFDLFFILKMIAFDDSCKKLVLQKLADKGINVGAKQFKKRSLKKLADFKDVWIVELKHFVLNELPDFKIVNDFVASKLKDF